MHLKPLTLILTTSASSRPAAGELPQKCYLGYLHSMNGNVEAGLHGIRACVCVCVCVNL